MSIACLPSKKRTILGSLFNLFFIMSNHHDGASNSSLLETMESSMTSAPIFGSRLPVGSSGDNLRITDYALFTATHWHWPPESWRERKWFIRWLSPTAQSTSFVNLRSLLLTWRQVTGSSTLSVHSTGLIMEEAEKQTQGACYFWNAAASSLSFIHFCMSTNSFQSLPVEGIVKVTP